MVSWRHGMVDACRARRIAGPSRASRRDDGYIASGLQRLPTARRGRAPADRGYWGDAESGPALPVAALPAPPRPADPDRDRDLSAGPAPAPAWTGAPLAASDRDGGRPAGSG